MSKLERFGSAIFKFIFFGTLSAYAYMYALADADWLPPALFGSGSVKNCWGDGNTGKDMRPLGWHFLVFYQVALSYHVSELIFQVAYESEKPDFVQMFAHHATTCFLVAASSVGNFHRIGSLVLIVHYFSDVPVYAAKIFVDTAYGATTALCLVGMLVSWGYLRLWSFPMVIIWSVYHDSVQEQGGEWGMKMWVTFIIGMMLLVCLHYYWYYLFLRMGYGYVVSGGKTKDIQANVSAMDLKADAKKDKKST